MATINFFLQSNSNPAGIYLRLREGRTIDAKAKTKYVVNPINWSTTKGQPKSLKEASTKKLHEDLIQLSTDLLNHYNNTSDKKDINTRWLKDFINPPIDAEAIPEKLVDYFTYYALHKKSSISVSTYKKLQVNKHLLERFEHKTKNKYYIKDVNADFKLNFEAYCRKENYATNTIARTLKYIKTICYHARHNGMETHFQLDRIAGKMEKVEKIYLTVQEMDKLQQTDFEHDYLKNARDWLIISCETGQRVSDFMRFTTKQIRYQGEVPLIEFTQIKTNKIMAIPLSKKVRGILEKSSNKFPRKITDQRYNEYIKEVCRIAGLTEKIKGSKLNKETKRRETGLFPKYELVTSHIGRRSFATNNYGYIPTSLLINVTGHTTESSFLEYIGKTVTEKAMQLAEYF